MKTRVTMTRSIGAKHARIAKALAMTCKPLVLVCAASVTHAQPATNFATGALWRQTWFNIPGNQVSDLLSDWGFPKLSSFTCGKKRLLLYRF